jgi:hypothetical protein
MESMSRWIALHAAVVLVALRGLGCGGGQETLASQDGGALGCDSDQVADGDGGCVTPGVPPEGCAEGFVPKDFGCEPVLPDGPCPEGTLAVPGDTVCREVMPCPSGTYPDPAGTGEVRYVNPQSSCAAGMTDCGTKEKPWTAIQDAIDSAPAGAQIAIAAGQYDENLVIAKPLTLLGVCPDRVELRGQSMTEPAVQIESGADGASLRGLALRGPYMGIGIQGAAEVTIDSLWVHDTGASGIVVLEGSFGVSIEETLIENTHLAGIKVSGVNVAIERSVVRATSVASSSHGPFGGVVLSALAKGASPDLVLRSRGGYPLRTIKQLGPLPCRYPSNIPRADRSDRTAEPFGRS